jgi:NTE family protein
MFKRPKVGLALGAGGARGIAHIGVLKVLEREKIPVDIITGSSAGSIVGAMYALNPSIEFVERKVRDFLNSKEYKQIGIDNVVKKQHNENLFSQLAENIRERIVINIASYRQSLVTNKRLKTAFDVLIGNGSIQNTKIKLGIIASDLVAGESVTFTHGDIITAVLASSSIPGFLPPIELNGRKLLDGDITDPIPIKPAINMGADVIIAVDVSPDLDNQNVFDNIIDIMMRYNSITSDAYKNLLLEKSDVIIRPNVGKYHWADFNYIDDLINEGIKAAEKNLVKIKRTIRKGYFFK